MTSFYILRQIIDIVLGLRECYREHKLTLWRWIKPKSWKFHFYNHTSINEINNFSAINTISRKSVRMPRQNTRRFAFFHTLYHFTKHGATWYFGGLLFDKDINNF